MNIELLFMPQHDPALPHSALPHLRGYLSRYLPDLNIKCLDLNLEFYKHVIGDDYLPTLLYYRKKMAESVSIQLCCKVAIDFEDWLNDKFKIWSKHWHGYNLTTRYLDTPFNRQSPESIQAFMNSTTPFDSFFLNFINSSEANLIGINLTVEDQILPSFKYAHLMRVNKPRCKIIFGGSLLSRIYPLVIDNFSKLIDYVIIREGEEPLLSLVNFLSGKISYPQYEPRIIDTSEKNKIEIVRNFDEELNIHTKIEYTGKQDFTHLSIYDYLNLEPMLPILASRGCYWGKCKFCTIHKSWDTKKRTRDVIEIFSEITDLVKKTGIKNYRFVDEACPPKILRPLTKLLIESNLDISFEIYGIADSNYLDQKFIHSLSNAGCKQIFFGLESIDQSALSIMGKNINNTNDLPIIFKNCSDAGIHVYAFALFGYPGVGKEANLKTIDFLINETNIHTVAIGSFVPVIGSIFAFENANLLHHSGQMTEDFDTIIINDNYVKARNLGKDDAKNAIVTVLSNRKDLSITSILSDETRFLLTKRFTNKFAQIVCEELPLSSINDNSSIIAKAIRQRVQRGTA